MQEKILQNKKHGMVALLLTSVIYLALIAVFVIGAIGLEGGISWLSPTLSGVALGVGGVYMCVGWIPFLGLKILKPQEALVLTLFGKYVGTIKGDGFYYVNPFCVGVNPAAKTKLNQSGDVAGGENHAPLKLSLNGSFNLDTANNKISLKIMTLKMRAKKSTIVWVTPLK